MLKRIKRLLVAVYSVTGHWWDRTGQILRVHLPATLAEKVNFKFSESLSQAIRAIEEDPQCPLASACPLPPTHEKKDHTLT